MALRGSPRRSQSRPPFVTEAARHLMDAGGKRFRPLLVLLAAEFGDPRRRRTCVTAACVVELTHLATLYHDDVMDEADAAPGRRVGQRPVGQPRRDPDRRLPVRRASDMTADLGAGRGPDPGAHLRPAGRGPDPRDRRARRDGEDPLAHYLRVVAGKTGSLIATSARFGARFAGRRAGGRGGADGVRRDDRRRLPALRRHPRHRLASPTESGKTPGTDLREGVPTLPVLIAQRSAGPARRPPAGAARPPT